MKIYLIRQKNLPKGRFFCGVWFWGRLDYIWYPRNYTPIEMKYPRAIYYWAKDVGLVKRENTKETYSWELIKYNIIK